MFLHDNDKMKIYSAIIVNFLIMFHSSRVIFLLLVLDERNILYGINQNMVDERIEVCKRVTTFRVLHGKKDSPGSKIYYSSDPVI